ncbi:hypothetical protein ACU4HD_43840 [Cupriavidus basilensis]
MRNAVMPIVRPICWAARNAQNWAKLLRLSLIPEQVPAWDWLF